MAPGIGDAIEFMSAAASRASKDENVMRTMKNFMLQSEGGLSYEDRNILLQSRLKTRESTQTGCTIGLLLGMGAAVLTIRRRRLAFRNLRSIQGTGATVRSPDGREEIITNLGSTHVRPTFARNLVTFGFWGTTGYVFGGMLGNSYGQKAMRDYQAQNPEAMKRIQAWERKFMLFVMRTALKNAEAVDAERSERDGINDGGSKEERGFDSWPPPDNPPEFPRSF
ncbi:hypothetical protein TWF506_006594 [Arthrobotrys conoides]|uniref:Uncharacterized protein n=1 Tax=Arthrobotrys conoides TaxID=74498 RepID=A0AAN8NH35_9PEZI